MKTQYKFISFFSIYISLIVLSILFNLFLTFSFKLENLYIRSFLNGFFILTPLYFIYKKKYLKYYDNNKINEQFSVYFILKLISYPVALFFSGCILMAASLVLLTWPETKDITFMQSLGFLLLPPANGLFILAVAYYYTIFNMNLGNHKKDLLTPVLMFFGYSLKTNKQN